MSTLTEEQQQAGRLTKWSWLMLPTLAVVYAVTSLLSVPILEARGQTKGDLFAMTEDVIGVALEVGFALVLAAAPVIGVIAAAKAVRRHAGGTARLALTANALLVLVVLYQFVDAIRMSFFAPLD